AEGGLGQGGDAPIARAVAGTARVALSPFDPRITGTLGVLHRMSLATDLRATLLARTVAGDLPRVALRLEHGVVMPGTHVDAALVGRGGEPGRAAVVLDAGAKLEVWAAGAIDGEAVGVSRGRIAGELSGLTIGDPVRAFEGVAGAGVRLGTR